MTGSETREDDEPLCNSTTRGKAGLINTRRWGVEVAKLSLDRDETDHDVVQYRWIKVAVV